jgi:hypothetical protein
VPYFHVVFTVPAPIGAIALQNKAVVYAILFKAAAEALTTLAANPHRLGAEIGAVAVLHTWGQALTHHPHLHCVVPGGGLGLEPGTQHRPGALRWRLGAVLAPLVGGALGGLLYRWLSEEPSAQVTGVPEAPTHRQTGRLDDRVPTILLKNSGWRPLGPSARKLRICRAPTLNHSCALGLDPESIFHRFLRQRVFQQYRTKAAAG